MNKKDELYFDAGYWCGCFAAMFLLSLVYLFPIIFFYKILTSIILFIGFIIIFFYYYRKLNHIPRKGDRQVS